MNLSPNFTLEEFTRSETAVKLKLSNQPQVELLNTLRHTAECMEEVRELLGNRPITITSGYRTQTINNAVGGAKSSQHLTGQAVDFICAGFGPPAAIMKRLAGSDLDFDQLILEFGKWVHISFPLPGRREKLVIDSTGTRFFT